MKLTGYFKKCAALSMVTISFVCSGGQEIDVSGNWEGEIQTLGSNSVTKSVALQLEQTKDGKVQGYVFYDTDSCVFAVEGQVQIPGRNAPPRVDLLEKSALTGYLDGCQFKKVTHGLGLSLTGGKLKVKGTLLSQMINAEESVLTRKSDFSERSKLIAKLVEKEKQAPKQWRAVLNTAVVKFLFPSGYASPNHFYVLADQIGPKGLGECTNSLYYQDGVDNNLTYLLQNPECDILPAGQFDVNTENNLKIVWHPKAANASAKVLVDQEISQMYHEPLTGLMWQLQDVYNNHHDSQTLSQIASIFLDQRKSVLKQVDDLIAKELSISQYGAKFMGAWQGYIRFSQPDRPEQQLEQAALALWLSGSDEQSEILGYLTISETCFFTMRLRDNKGSAALSTRKSRLRNTCNKEQVSLVLPRFYLASMNAERNLLKLEPGTDRNRVKPSYGIFQRKTPTPYLMSLLTFEQGQRFALPQEEMTTLMIAAQVPDEQLEKQHAQSMQDSAELLAKKAERLRIQEIEMKKREKVRLEKEQKYRTAAHQTKLRKSVDSHHAREARLPVVTGPFDGLPGSAFLNAVYRGDETLVQRFNRVYANKKADGLKAFFGRYGNDMTNAVADLHKKVKIEDSVAAKYLFEYEKRFGRCLSESPATFYVTGYQPDMVVTNLLGVEIARHYGGVTKTKYQVNPEFTGVFQKIGKMQPQGVAARLTSFLAGQKEKDLRELSLTGVDQIFNKFSCDSPEIKVFETNLIKLF
ncbi:hypothetical protein [Alteromonas sp. S015]|uniref:hypothetical protein n=1 Tax=Alteromonas sp. S015 TaxID=3117401 RepID=UPI002FE3B49B